MVATYVGVNTDVVVSSPTTSTTVSSFPSGHAAGNLMMLHLRAQRFDKTTPTFTVNQGFTQAARITATGNSDAVVSEIWFKVAEGTAGSEPQPTVTISSMVSGATFGVSLYEFADTQATYLAGPTGKASPTGTGTGIFTPDPATITKDGLAFVAFVNGNTGGTPSITTTQGFTSIRTYTATIRGQTAYKAVSTGTVTYPSYTRGSTVDSTCSITLVFGVVGGAGWSVGQIKY